MISAIAVLLIVINLYLYYEIEEKENEKTNRKTTRKSHQHHGYRPRRKRPLVNRRRP